MTTIPDNHSGDNTPQPELVEYRVRGPQGSWLVWHLAPDDPRIIAQRAAERRNQAAEGQSQNNGHHEPPWWISGLSADEFITAAQANYERGWHPIPVGKKHEGKPACKAPWIKGLTGTKGIDAPPEKFSMWAAQIQKWIETEKYEGILNLGIRMPVGVIGIDADGYDGKYGLQTIARLEHHWGTLPPTYYLTARDDGSRIRLYRVPDDWKGITNAAKLSWLKDDVPEGADLGVEFIQRHHRHVMPPPSVHHTGKRYQLFGPDDHVIGSGVLPPLDDVPWLPELWCDGLYDDARAEGGQSATSAEVKEFGERWFYEDHPYNLTTILNDLTAKFASNLKDTYAPTFSALCQAAREAKGHCFAWNRAEPEIQALAAKHYAARGRAFDWENYNHAVNDAVGYAIKEDEQKLIERYAKPWDKNGQTKLKGTATMEAGENLGDPTEPSEEEINSELKRINKIAEAKRRALLTTWVEPEDQGNLAYKLENLPPKPELLVSELIPVNSIVLVNAQFKSGKSTLMSVNLVKSLICGTRFLGRFDTRLDIADCVGVWNLELSDRMLSDWLALTNMDGKAAERVYTFSRRGDTSLNFDNPLMVDWTVKWLREHNITVWVIDPLSKLYRGSENENNEFNHWWLILEEIARLAELKAVILIHHTGHTEEAQDRGRGASAMMGNPDVLITYRHNAGAGKLPDPNDNKRFLRAFGRDVSVDEFEINFDPVTNELTATGGGSRAESKKVDLAIDATMAVLRLGSVNATNLYASLNWRKGKRSDDYLEAISYAEQKGWIRREPQGNSVMHSAGKDSGQISDDGIKRKILGSD